MRFDFHFTSDGWRISEVNSDVPGGFTESSHFSRLMREHYQGTDTAGDPIAAWIKAFGAFETNFVLLLAAPGFMEDQQIVKVLAKALAAHSIRAQVATPSQLFWKNGFAGSKSRVSAPVDAVVRFYQTEWLPKSGIKGWNSFFRGGRTPVVNPGRSILTESKRFPLIWGSLKARLPTWEKLLPQTAHPREVDRSNGDNWLLKSAFSNNGDSVSIRSAMPKRAWRELCLRVRLSPKEWVAQQRFEPLWFDSPIDVVHACIGVYTINGKAVGAYGRLTDREIIDYTAIDVPILIERTK
jgi:glutathionylspermidine synthase